jgi:DNA repair protein RadC
LELGRRRRDSEETDVFKIGGSRDIFDLLQRDFADLNHEEFWIILLNRGNKVLSKHLISKGGQAGTVADPKIIFRIALEHHAAAVILAHNHPSGNLKPSQADINLTQKLCTSGTMLDIAVLDHVIFCDSTYLSFADEGII